MAKKTSANYKNNFPDPVLFYNILLPQVDHFLRQNGGMENLLRQNPELAKITLVAAKNLENRGVIPWLSDNFSIPVHDSEDTLARMKNACEQQSTDISGDTDSTSEGG